MEIKERFLKRAFDILFSVILIIIFLLPISVIFYILNKIQGFLNPSFKGPLFYREPRVSRGKVFTIYKFSTIKPDIISILMKENKPVKEYSTEQKNLTPFGSFLYKHYIDETPQLLNILRGEMSLVGPRPLSPVNYTNCLKSGMRALKFIKGGLFGLPQSTKGHPELSEALYKMATGKDIDCSRFIALDKLYLQKYIGLSSFNMLVFDLWIIYRCIIMAAEAKGL